MGRTAFSYAGSVKQRRWTIPTDSSQTTQVRVPRTATAPRSQPAVVCEIPRPEAEPPAAASPARPSGGA